MSTSTLVNWRGLMAPAKMRPADKEALDEAMGEMVRSDEWQALLKERGWVDMYQPAEEFAAFLEAGADADRGHPAGSSDWSSKSGDGSQEGGRAMTTGWGLRIGEAVLGGVVLGLGLFVAIETSLMEVAASNAAIGPRLFPFLIAFGLLAVGRGRALAGLLRPYRA